MNKKTIVIILIGMLLLLGACSDSGSEAEVTDLDDLTLMLNWTPNAHHSGIYLAEANGWYEEAGINLEIVDAAGAGNEKVVAEGGADIGLSQAESLLPARQAGVDVKAVAALLPANDSAFMSLKTKGVERPKDLEGLTNGGFEGALETEIISKLVECDGGDPSKVEFIGVGNVDYVAGLEEDKFDFVWVFDGWDVLRATQLGKDVNSLSLDDYKECIPNWYTPLVFADSDNADSELTKKFLEITAKGYAAVVEDPDAAADAFIKLVPEADEELVRASIAYYAPLFNAGDDWGKMDTDTWAEFSKFLAEADETYENQDDVWQGAFTNDALLG